jgi:hypothetical protein
MPWATHWNGSRMLNGKMRDVPIDPHMLELVQITVLRPFGLDDRLLAVGETVTVSRARADYLVFLQWAAWV